MFNKSWDNHLPVKHDGFTSILLCKFGDCDKNGQLATVNGQTYTFSLKERQIQIGDTKQTLHKKPSCFTATWIFSYIYRILPKIGRAVN